MIELGLAVKNSSQNEYISECWPKEAVWYDYLNPKTRDYFKKIYSKIPENCDD